MLYFKFNSLTFKKYNQEIFNILFILKINQNKKKKMKTKIILILLNIFIMLIK